MMSQAGEMLLGCLLSSHVSSSESTQRKCFNQIRESIWVTRIDTSIKFRDYVKNKCLVIECVWVGEGNV
jgi:hypothetical protein